MVQRRVSEALDAARPGPVHLLSMCAGQGRDVIGPLVDHARRGDVVARLVDLDADLVADARAAASAAGLSNVEVVEGDASTTSAYAGMVPAAVVLVCGVFGNVVDEDVHTTVRELRRLCTHGGVVIWTRHRRDPDLTPAIRGWFADAGFTELGFDGEPGSFGVGVHRFDGTPMAYRTAHRMFTFVGDGSDARF